MATFYLDPENGNDANDGTTFANRWKTLTNGATAARLAPGDSVRIIGCQAPTLVGSAVWNRNENLNPTASVAISAVSNATPIQITTSAAHGLSTGDVVRVHDQTGNRYVNGLWVVTVVDTTNFTLDDSVAAGAGGTATGSVRKLNHKVIVLATKVNQTIDMCEVTWTASANVSASLTSTANCAQGSGAANLNIAAGFTTGKVAYRTLPSTLDLSGYEQVSLFIRSSVAVNSGVFTLRLCSDTTGDTTVNTITLPAIATTGCAVTIDTGAALGASIASIALYAESDPGAVIVVLDCIIACKDSSADDALSLTTVIGKNDGYWAAVGSIEGRVITLDTGYKVATNANNIRDLGWYEATATADLYILKPLYPGRDTGLWSILEAGITISGGWNRTDMSTQDGSFTMIDGGAVNSMRLDGLSDVTVSDIGFARFADFGIRANFTPVSNITFHNLTVTGCYGSAGIRLFVDGENITEVSITGYLRVIGAMGTTASSCGIYINDSFVYYGTGTISVSADCLFLGCLYGFSIVCPTELYVSGDVTCVGSTSFLYATRDTGILRFSGVNTLYATQNFIYVADTGTLYKCYVNSVVADKLFTAISLNGSSNIHLFTCNSWVDTNMDAAGQFLLAVQTAAEILIQSFDSSYTTLLNVSNAGYGQPKLKLGLGNFGGVSTDHRTYTWPQGLIRSETSVRHTASGYAWKMQPESDLHTVVNPLLLLVGKIYVQANKLVTVTGWVRRTHTDIKIGLIAYKNQLAGMTVDYSDEITAAIDTWEQLSFTFTPTESGVVDVYAYCYGSITESGYVDDISITQAS